MIMENGGVKRLTISAIAAALVLGAFGGAAQQTTGYALQASGGDAWAYRTMVSAMDKTSHFFTSPLFIILACVAVGAAVYSWTDFVVRKWTERWRLTDRLSFGPLDRKLIAMSLMLFFGGGLALSALWVAGERFLVSQPTNSNPPPKTATGNPLWDSINVYLAKSGKTANHNSPRPTVVMEDTDQGKRPYIARWPEDTLGTWPTVEDGFTPEELRNSPHSIYRVTKPGPTNLLNRKAEANEAILKILRDEMGPPLKTPPRSPFTMESAYDPKDFVRDLQQFSDKMQKADSDLKKILTANTEFSDIVGTSGQAPQIEFNSAISQLLGAFRSLDQLKSAAESSGLARQIVSAPQDAYSKAVANYQSWHKTALTRTIDIQRQLAQ